MYTSRRLSGAQAWLVITGPTIGGLETLRPIAGISVTRRAESTSSMNKPFGGSGLSGRSTGGLVRDAATRLVFFNLVTWGTFCGLVMFWTNQKYWQDSGVPLAYFGVLLASYSLIVGFAGRSVAPASARYGRRPLFAAVGVLPIIAYFGMASFLGWGGILFGALVQVSWGLGQVLFLDALNEKISSAFRATVNSMAQL